MNAHAFHNSNPSEFDSNCTICEGKKRDAIHNVAPTQPTPTPQQAKAIAKAQEIVNELATFPQYAQYVRSHRLHLIDGRLSNIDRLLDAGILTTPTT